MSQDTLSSSRNNKMRAVLHFSINVLLVKLIPSNQGKEQAKSISRYGFNLQTSQIVVNSPSFAVSVCPQVSTLQSLGTQDTCNGTERKLERST